MFYETRVDNPKKYFRVLSFVFYTIIKNYFCVGYLDFLLKQLSEITVGCRGGYKYGGIIFERILGIGIPDFFMNLMSCHGF